MQRRGASVIEGWQTRFPAGLPSYTVLNTCEIHVDDDTRAELIAGVEATLEPTPVRDCEALVAELSLITKQRAHQGDSAEMLLTAYSSRLSEYPIDALLYAMRKTKWEWFPSWLELSHALDVAVQPRRAMLNALRNPPAPPEPPRTAPTEAEKRRMTEYIKGKFPNRSEDEIRAEIDAAQEKIDQGEKNAEESAAAG